MSITIWLYFNEIYENVPGGWVYCVQLYSDDYPVDFGIADSLDEAKDYFLASHGELSIDYEVPNCLIDPLELVDADFLNPDRTKIPT